MSSTTTHQVQAPATRAPLLNLSHLKARAFFLKSSIYCKLDLPSYFDFDSLLSATASVLATKPLATLRRRRPSELPEVNYRLLVSKHDRYAWRPLDLIHPALYISLVDTITDPCNWEDIVTQIAKSRAHVQPSIECLSIPVVPLQDEKTNASQISHWWRNVEQRSIQLSLEYGFFYQTDIADCYSNIYTHSIPWALHGKRYAKENPTDRTLLGNIIDCHIRDMRHGQTNGIPQGSVLMDFVAEIVLAYSDTELAKRLKCQSIGSFHILRYRDDYRVFVNNPQDGELVLKSLTEVMADLGMRLNPTKTQDSSEVIRSSIKRDKLAYNFRRQSDRDLQKHLLIIHDHATQYPKSGSLVIALQNYHSIISKVQQPRFPLTLISIVADIAYHNPRAYNITAAILGHLIQALDSDDERRSVVEKIRRRFSQIPNTGHLQIWLQRISHPFNPDLEFDEPLCRLVQGKDVQIWDNQWISSKDLLKAVDPSMIVDFDALRDMSPIVPTSEIELFPTGYS